MVQTSYILTKSELFINVWVNFIKYTIKNQYDLYKFWTINFQLYQIQDYSDNKLILYYFSQ